MNSVEVRTSRAESHQPATAKLRFPGLPVYEQFRVQPEAGIDEENLLVDEADLYRPCGFVQHYL